MPNESAFQEYFCPTRAFQINFTIGERAQNVSSISAGDLTFLVETVGSLAFNRVTKLEARFAVSDFERRFEVSLAKIAALNGIAAVEQVLVSLYETGTVVTRLICRLEKSIAEFGPDELGPLDAAVFRANEPISQAVFRLCGLLASSGIIVHSDILAFDGAASANGGMRRADWAAPDEAAFVKHAEWRAWGDTQIVVAATTDPVLLRDHLKKGASSSFDGGDLDVYRFGMTTVWVQKSAIEFKYSDVADLLEPSGYLIAKRSIIASATETLRRASDAFAAGTPTLSGRTLRRYLALVRGEMARCNLFRISTTADQRRLFLWLEENLSSLAQGVIDFNDAEETVRLAIDNHDRSIVERISRGLNAIFMLFAAIAFVGVVADALGFVDFSNEVFPLAARVFIIVLSVLLAIVAVGWSIFLLSRADAD